MLNKATPIFRRTATAIEIHTGIIKTDISDHFSKFLNVRNSIRQEEKSIRQTKRGIIDATIEYFKQGLRSVNWSDLKMVKHANAAFLLHNSA